MNRLIGAAVVAAGVAFSVPAAIGPASAAPSKVVIHANEASGATDLSARRRYRHYRYAYRPYYRPYYYGRPYYYRPYPYYAPAPFPFGFGFGFGPVW